MPNPAELTAFLRPLEDKLFAAVDREHKANQRKLLPPDVNRAGNPTYKELRARYSPDGTQWGLQLMPGKHYEKRKRSDEDKMEALADARVAGKALSGMKLMDETVGLLKQQDDNRHESSPPSQQAPE